jgi:thiosulfate/3-mercaptopyruvate sulfurtransferase
MALITQYWKKHIGFLTIAFFMYAGLGLSPAPSYAYDISFVNTDALHRSAASWIVIDARPKNRWEKGHIPQARSFGWEDYTKVDENNISHRILSSEKLANVLGEMGIDENTQVVVYGDADTSWGAEGWVCWMLTWLGHKGPIRLLNGGIQQWTDLNYPVAKGDDRLNVVPVKYLSEVRKDVSINTGEIKNSISGIYLIDTRSTFEWIKGHIPGAIHISWKKFYKGDFRIPLEAHEVKKLLASHGIKQDKPVVYYCSGGIRSAYAWLVHQLAGMQKAMNYEGGMSEWKHYSSKQKR